MDNYIIFVCKISSRQNS